MIANIKDLEKLLKLLRKQGVTEFKSQEIEMKLGDLPVDRNQVTQPEDEVIEDAYANFPTGMLTDAQAIHYASGGVPENDPELTRQ